MKIVKNVLYGLVALIVLLTAVGLVALPRVTKVERSLVIQAPADVIFDQVNDLKKNEAWSPWKDPEMTLTYGAITVGKGATSTWASKKMGNGTMTISESVPASSIDVDLDFGSMGGAKAVWTFVSSAEGVKVTETMTSDAGMNPMKRWMGLMTEKMVGPYYERGLASLKQVSETRAAELKTEQASQQAVATPAEDAAAPGAAPAAAPKR